MTVQDIINKALISIGVIASGESPAPEETADAFDTLNSLIESWATQQVLLYSVESDIIPLTGAASYTLPARPARIKTAMVIAANGASQPPALVDATGWAGIPDKTRTGIYAEALYCDYGFPAAQVFLSPRPSTGTLEIFHYRQLTAFGSTTATVSLPPGYDRALILNLAIELAPQYGRPVDQALLATASEAKGSLSQLNALVLGEAVPGAAATAQAAR